MGSSSSSRAASLTTVSVDVVIVSRRERRLLLLVAPSARSGSGTSLPWGVLRRGETLADAAARIARAALGAAPSWLEQVGAFTDGGGHPGNAAVSVCFVAVSPRVDGARWQDVEDRRGMNERHRHLVSSSLHTLGLRLEQSSLAFSMLPAAFTLTELQQTYETLLGRRLHKASFRRSLEAASLVKPTGEWRVEGRGRPAQLFRYAPRRRRRQRRGIRLDV